MGNLSDGQKSRVVLSKMAKENPHLLLLDEPTNHLDMESIDSLAKAINRFGGGVVLVSHDMRLISQVAREIWMCDNKTIMRYQGEISDFKMQIQQQLESDSLIEAGSGKKKAFSTASGPVLVPLGAPRKYGSEPTKTMTMAPPAPPTAKDFPALGAAKPRTAEEEVLAARMELAELAISRQRKRQADEKAAKEMTEEEKSAVAELEARKQQEKQQEAEAEESARAEKKRERKAEREKAAAYQAEQEALKEARRLEKEADLVAARKMQEDMEVARNERQRLREEKAQREREAEEARVAAEQAAKDARRAERQRVKREREAAKAAVLQREKEAWMGAARRDVWTQEQQTALERALLAAPLILESRGAETMAAEKRRRWSFVAAAVPGKHRNQCLLRYKLLLQVVKDHRALQAKE
jgi:energy-coupling factor transporter ATP-binding protein EcfA2